MRANLLAALVCSAALVFGGGCDKKGGGAAGGGAAGGASGGGASGGGASGGGGAAAKSKAKAALMAACVQRNGLHEGLVKILEANVATPKKGFKAAQAYVDKSATEMKRLGKEVVKIAMANKPQGILWYRDCALSAKKTDLRMAKRVRPIAGKFGVAGNLGPVARKLLGAFKDEFIKLKVE